ncbi:MULTISPECIES: ATP-binding protein [Stutzerimonas stutzeri subgroup]|jgi:two-component system sensor histidine kinase RstB|uniref:histidine kinase n=1 Tax=Stutzerimonas stutzeri NF13 TaxID=1212548 RepID=M2TKM4_STUST|nr:MULTISPECIES: ATP-binding protein [Stutzerimonas stutzeri subgroup]EMD98015.1 sensor histidine kinase [Stutzerimonas stutzeri NF13]MBK3880823.1 HAMP domain-containing protein [Stutzerimonas stutzeri]MCQ4292936.1 ATP-binding protein [Stutzerimonas stutzeri]WOF79784.1 ATP-binding protein [Pseudomonas sp. FeN3W]
MNSIFLRIYGGMLGVLVLVALLGTSGLHLLNQYRADDHRERLASGTFRLMAHNMSSMTPIERRQAANLWGRLLGIPLRVRTLDDVSLERRLEARLLRGQVLVEQIRPQSTTVFSLVSAKDRLVLTGEVEQLSEQLARATIYLLIDELIRYPEAEQPRRLAELKKARGFGFDLELLTRDSANLDDDQRRRLDEGDTVMALARGGDAVRVFAAIAGTGWIMQLGPLYQMNPYPPQLLVLIGLLGLSLIGLTVYLLVRQLEQRLSVLEGAATRIAAGNLETRVPDVGTDSVGRLAAAFNGMARHLQRLLAVQREMVSAVAHELRTPVARLRFGLEMSAEAQTDEARRKYLEGMDGDIDDLDALVDEMLVYSRLERGSPTLHFQQVDLGALVDQVIGELAPLRADVGVSRGECITAADGSCWAEAEPQYLRRALSNLITNAMRHAERQVQVSFAIDGQTVRLEVDDDGPGVPEADWEKVFTPFLRLDDSRTRASGGHGLGLSIVRRIIYWHGGRSQLGHSDLGGARFSLLWPRRRADQAAAG